MVPWLMVLLFMPACIIPIPAEVEQSDAAIPNSAPVIIESTPVMPGFVSIDTRSPQPRSVTVRDTNIGDTLYVRVFRDYQIAIGPPFNDTQVSNDPINGTPVRLVPLPTNTWCNGAALDTDIVFDVVVADRPFNPDPSVKPEYRSVPPDAEYSVRSWVAKCVQGP